QARRRRLAHDATPWGADLDGRPGHAARAFYEILLLVMRWLVVVLLVLTVATTFATDQDGPWLTGQFLVATEQIGGPPFARAVIYMILHDSCGEMGLIVNRPVGEVPLARVLDTLGRDETGVNGHLGVHYRGPVSPPR